MGMMKQTEIEEAITTLKSENESLRSALAQLSTDLESRQIPDIESIMQEHDRRFRQEVFDAINSFVPQDAPVKPEPPAPHIETIDELLKGGN